MSNYDAPNGKGKYGEFGGKYIPETLTNALLELEQVYQKYKDNSDFLSEYNDIQKYYNGRPTPLYMAENLTKHFGKASIYLKREDLCHTGAHKLNNCIGQILLAKRLGKSRIIAETGAGQHGVATASVCAKFGLKCIVYMGKVDMARQELNVFRMKMMGAEVIPVTSGSKTLKDATNEAIRDWVSNIRTTHYIIGSVVGPHPYPKIVRDFQSVIGIETKAQILELQGRLPDYIVACVGGGSNAMGMFYPFINTSAKLIGVEAGGEGIDTNKHSATITIGETGIFHGMKTKILQDDCGQISEVHSISAGLDYPGVGPEHAYLNEINLASYHSVTDKEALDACTKLSELEGILPALESSHALAYLNYLIPRTSSSEIVVVNLSGRGDKDLGTIMNNIEE